MTGTVDPQVAKEQDVVVRVVDPDSETGPEPSEEFLQRKRLHHIVVGSSIEASDAIPHLVARRQHQDRRVVASVSDPSTHAETVGVRHRHIKQQQVGWLLSVKFQRSGTVTHRHHLIALENQRPFERLANSTIVFGDENPGHGPYLLTTW